MYRAIAAVVAILLFIPTYTYAISYFHDTLNSQAKLLRDDSKTYIAYTTALIVQKKLENNHQLLEKILNGNLKKEDKDSLLESVRNDISELYNVRYNPTIKITVYILSLEYTDNGVTPEWTYGKTLVINSTSEAGYYSSSTAFIYKNFEFVVTVWL